MLAQATHRHDAAPPTPFSNDGAEADEGTAADPTTSELRSGKKSKRPRSADAGENTSSAEFQVRICCDASPLIALLAPYEAASQFELWLHSASVPVHSPVLSGEVTGGCSLLPSEALLLFFTEGRLHPQFA